MWEVSKGHPKCLQEVGGRALIEHQLESLEMVSIRSVCLVVGHRASAIRHHLRWVSGCRFIENEIYAETNSLYSLWLARETVQGPFLILNGDVIAHREVYRRLLAHEGTCLAFDSSSRGDDEQMRVSFDGSRLRRISKLLSRAETDGENIGMLKISAEVSARFFEVVGHLAATPEGRTLWAPAALDYLAAEVPITGVDVSDLPWAEIDLPEDLYHAKTEILPRLGFEATA